MLNKKQINIYDIFSARIIIMLWIKIYARRHININLSFLIKQNV